MNPLFWIPTAAAHDGVTLPPIPAGGAGQALGLLLVALLFTLMAGFIGRRRALLRSGGWLPGLLGLSETSARALAALAWIGVFVALLPENLLPAMPWFVLAVAVAIGWSAQAFIPDLIAGVVLRVGGRVTPGRWVQLDGQSGAVSSIGLFGTALRSPAGALMLPNRRFLEQALRTPADQRPVAAVSAVVPLPASRTRRLLREIALGAPWCSPGAEPEISHTAAADAPWTVRIAVLEPHHIPQFQSTFYERLEEALLVEAS